MGLESPEKKDFAGIVISMCPGWERYDHIKDAIYGIEEEEVPFKIHKEQHKPADTIPAAYDAAVQSVFGIGMGCSRKSIVIHHHKLIKQNPLFILLSSRCIPKTARILGQNAARLVKGMPLRTLPGV